MKGGFLKRYWFLVALLCLIPVGLWAPEPGLYVKAQGHIIPVFVGLMLGISGQQLRPLRQLAFEAMVLRHHRRLFRGLGHEKNATVKKNFSEHKPFTVQNV